jgi:hypothetical protein
METTGARRRHGRGGGDRRLHGDPIRLHVGRFFKTAFGVLGAMFGF